MSNSKLYLSNIWNYNNPKNKFQEAVWDLIRKNDRIMTDNPSQLIGNLAVGIGVLHKKYPRCGKISVDVYAHAGHGSADTRCVIGDFIWLAFLDIKGRVVDGVVQPYLDFGKGGAES